MHDGALLAVFVNHEIILREVEDRMSLLIDDAHAQLHQRSVSLDNVILRRGDGRFQGEGEHNQQHGAK